MNSPWSIRLVRALFFPVFVFIGITIALGFEQPAWIGAVTGATVMGLLLALDMMLARVTLRDFSHATFGLGIGLFCAWLVTRIGVFQLDYFQTKPGAEALQNLVQIIIYASLAFFGVSVALRSDRDQFAFMIPYVQFRREGAEGDPLLLDTNIIIDGRILKVAQTGFLSGPLVVPRFVLDELQRLTESGDSQKKLRGKRGLEVMEKLRAFEGVRLSVFEPETWEKRDDLSVDARLAHLARQLNARLLTNDQDLAKVAKLRGVGVLSLSELVVALQPSLNPGDEIQLSLLKPGKDKHQAVGYLPDGTMIVVNQAASFIGQTVDVIVGGALPTTAGRLVFAELKTRQGSPLVSDLS